MKGEMMFDAKKVKNDIVKWIEDWFENNGKGCKAVIGISGGKDSSVVAALCVEALGRENVIGVLMPRGEQFDIDVSHALCEHLGIESTVMNIKQACDGIEEEMLRKFGGISLQTKTNIPPRIRMTMLYAVCQTVGGRVANTCNLSEDYVGYNTIFGDNAGDFSPLSMLTVQEVKAVGRELGLPSMFVDKVPVDGLQGKTDEDNLGFTYEVLDRYIRTGICENPEDKAKIDRKHQMNLFKLKPMPTFEYKGEIYE
ncbi:MAG: NAD(+) synthase [Eubacteriales bacterium]|nr:NAD(+) synthase [Eubacteriales bacterium]